MALKTLLDCRDTATSRSGWAAGFHPAPVHCGRLALPGGAPDVNLESSYVHQYKLEISGYLILSIGYFTDLKTPRFCGT
jgi:hypothetical protein